MTNLKVTLSPHKFGPKSEMSHIPLESIYEELGVSNTNASFKKQLLGDTARMMELTEERNERRRQRYLEREVEKETAAKQKKVDAAVVLEIPMKFKQNQFGNIVCGERNDSSTETKIAATVPGKHISPLMSALPTDLLSQTKKPSSFVVVDSNTAAAAADDDDDVGTSIQLPAPKAECSAEDEDESRAGLDGELGKWRRVTAAAYVDVYLNGGRYEPSAQSLMEEGHCVKKSVNVLSRVQLNQPHILTFPLLQSP
jgi:hypothetical protein